MQNYIIVFQLFIIVILLLYIFLKLNCFFLNELSTSIFLRKNKELINLMPNLEPLIKHLLLLTLLLKNILRWLKILNLLLAKLLNQLNLLKFRTTLFVLIAMPLIITSMIITVAKVNSCAKYVLILSKFSINTLIRLYFALIVTVSFKWLKTEVTFGCINVTIKSVLAMFKILIRYPKKSANDLNLSQVTFAYITYFLLYLRTYPYLQVQLQPIC